MLVRLWHGLFEQYISLGFECGTDLTNKFRPMAILGSFINVLA